ncbi:MAG: RpiB/LacA/LacB family sugar-phosphate isomerase [bacterium]|nr:RpiB/LacA/LacB family sugar-phosphate isomerase [bacterium]
MIYIGADHRGFQLKEDLKTYLAELGEQAEDVGAATRNPDDDYPDFAQLVGEKVARNREGDRGILICGSGIGIAIAANKITGVRCGLCLSGWMAEMGRRDDDINVLALAADITDLVTAKRIVSTFLEAQFAGEERHRRRVGKIAMLEPRSMNHESREEKSI